MSTVRPLALPITSEADDAELLRAVVAYYAATLKTHAAGLDYLKKRGISDEAIDAFGLGFSDRTLGLKLPLANRSQGKAIRERLQRLGILKASGHEALRGALTIPLFDEQDRVVQVYGRMVSDRLRPEVPRHLWLPGARRGLLNRQALSSKTVIVTAGLIDALTFWSHGHLNVTAVHGLDGPTEDLLDALSKAGCRQVLLAVPRTPEGDAGAESLGQRLVERGLEVYRVLLPQGRDVNDLARTSAEPSQALGDALRGAVWVGKGNPAPESARASGGPPNASESAPLGVSEGDAERDLAKAPLAPVTPIGSAPKKLVVPAEETGPDEITIRLGERLYRVRGLAKNAAVDALKVNLLVALEGEAHPSAGFHVDTLDLYQARQRAAFTKQAATELGVGEEVIRHDLARVPLQARRPSGGGVREEGRRARRGDPRAVGGRERRRPRASRPP